ncbi:MAG: ClbS/DfsB family four-helix bundle protein [Candidatus Hodarchaeota archaeon]
MTKPQLIEDITVGRKKFEATLSQLDEDQMTTPGLESGWSVKDVLAHIQVWETRMIQWLEDSQRGEVPQMLPPGLTWDDLDQMNEETYLQNRDRPLSEILAEFHQSFPKALDTVKSISEEDLLDPDRYEWREGKPLWFIVAANTHWHYDEHDKVIKEWLGGQ